MTGISVLARAPASTANIGPGFDCVAAALELWNELRVEARSNGGPWVSVEGEGVEELPRDRDNLALRAFALFAPPERYAFRFLNRIPIGRGLGSSAAAIATGLTAGAAAAGRRPAAGELLALGAELEGHTDNLAAALHGGICLAWRRGDRPLAARAADDLPFVPIAVVPDERASTSDSRGRLPATVGHADAAGAAGSAAVLGAAIASGDPTLFRDAVGGDRLHEPYRAASAPLLGELRRRLPRGAAGATLSGSGPSVVVWAERAHAAAVAEEVTRRLPDVRVLPLEIARAGAEAR